MKIASLLEEMTELLAEHLGNLTVVDKELLSVISGNYIKKNNRFKVGFKPHWDDKKAKAGAVDWSEGTTRNTNSLYASYGQHSEVTTASLTGSEIMTMINAKEAVIIKHKGKQVGIIRKDGTDDVVGYIIKFTKAFARAEKDTPLVVGKTFNTELGKILPKTLAGEIPTAHFVLPKGGAESLLQLMRRLEWAHAASNVTAKIFPKDDKLPKLDVMVISPDKERVAKHDERKKNREGLVAVPRSPNMFITSKSGKYVSETPLYRAQNEKLKNSLRYRLNAHKNSKAKSFTDPADLLKYILDEGYLNKLTYMGTAYNLKDSNINFDELRKGDKGNKSYNNQIIYQAETNTSYSDEAYMALAQDRKELIAEFKKQAPPMPEGYHRDEDEWKSDWAYDRIKPMMAKLYEKHKITPSKLVVRLALKGGKIEPYVIEHDYGYL